MALDLRKRLNVFYIGTLLTDDPLSNHGAAPPPVAPAFWLLETGSGGGFWELQPGSGTGYFQIQPS